MKIFVQSKNELLGIYPEEIKTEKDTCTPKFTAALFTIARTWKQPRCPPTDEWIKKIRYIHKMEYCSAIKRKVFESVLMRWTNLKPVLQNEVSQKDKNKHRLFFIAWIKILSFIPTINTSSLPSRGQGAVFSGQRDRM